ncbi:MAG TPA: SgcJ/EcaC family oxidoreductase [Patescibacteria group bacterium]|nr:SgcJ/EcaC family oxidoreductase [Patescibacteria group bacterium]
MDKDENAIRELVNRWLAASKAGDINTLLTLMAEDVLFLVPGREPFGKDLFAASAQAMKDVKIEGTSEIKELKIIGDWAWMRNRLVMTTTPSAGKPTLRSGYTLTILRKKPDGSWVVARDANLLP